MDLIVKILLAALATWALFSTFDFADRSRTWPVQVSWCLAGFALAIGLIARAVAL